MSDYSPDLLAEKWGNRLAGFLEETRQLWDKGRPIKKFLSFGEPEADSSGDESTPLGDRQKLAYSGKVVFGHFARAFVAAYIPGKNTHYGSVVYSASDDPSAVNSVFDLAWKVNELRQDDSEPPPGTEKVANAIRNDRSNFARIELPAELGTGRGCYFANICVLRSRLPLSYLHTRLVPILIAPERTDWCCLLPLRFWCREFQKVWSSGPPAYPAEGFKMQCHFMKVIP